MTFSNVTYDDIYRCRNCVPSPEVVATTLSALRACRLLPNSPLPTRRGRRSRRSKSPPLFGLANVRSLCNKGASVVEHIDSLRLDMLTITESWLTAGTGDAVIRAACPPGYTAMHRPRPSTGGGVALIFKNTIDVQRLVNDTFESLNLLVATRRTSKTFQLLIVYRPPSTPVQHFMSEFSSIVEPILASNYCR